MIFPGASAVYDVATGQERGTVPPGAVAFGPGDNSIAVAKDGRVRILDLRSGATLNTLPVPLKEREWHLAWSPDGRWMAFLGHESLEVLDLSTGRSAMTAAGLPNYFPEGVFKPDSDELWTYGGDLIEVWQVTTGKKLRSRTLPDALIYSLAITREENVMLAGIPASGPKSTLPVQVWEFAD